MDYYDSIAPGYNQLHKQEQLAKLMLIKQECPIEKTDVILDIGGGTCFAAEVFQNHIINVEPANELLKQSKAQENIQGSMDAIPLDDHVGDVLLCITAIHHCKDIDQTLREFLRVGKNTFVITLLKKSQRYQEISEAIKKTFSVDKELDNQHDTIFILSRCNSYHD